MTQEEDEARLDAFVGRVVRDAVQLEWQLRLMWNMLVVPSPMWYLSPTSVPVLVDEIKAMISHIDLSVERLELATKCLEKAKHRYEFRNQLAHHRLGPVPDSDNVSREFFPRGRTSKRAGSPDEHASWTWAEMHEMHEDLLRSTRVVQIFLGNAILKSPRQAIHRVHVCDPQRP